MRPNFWPNTPDILSGPLRHGPPAAFLLRFVLAATLVPSYGIYSGYELFENEPASDTNEEYLALREVRAPPRATGAAPTRWRRSSPRSTRSAARHPAFRWLPNVRFHGSANERSWCGPRASVDDGDLVLVVVNLDPHNAQETVLDLDLGADRPALAGSLPAHDELGGDDLHVGRAHPLRAPRPRPGPGGPRASRSELSARARRLRRRTHARRRSRRISSDGRHRGRPAPPRSGRAPAGRRAVAPGQGGGDEHGVGVLGPRVDADGAAGRRCLGPRRGRPARPAAGRPGWRRRRTGCGSGRGRASSHSARGRPACRSPGTGRPRPGCDRGPATGCRRPRRGAAGGQVVVEVVGVDAGGGRR